ncbi:hypothetical protein BpHYR1_034448 [Brachionus plicatilis]|uniref:Uncharacterized protein n=1 Tax=Brachionus plicatilis TaxID=10195 RepID=A0A3M7SBX2_BRAPC|nr:hypothetical protein BpHYR1_034448 [Brachionus plicatilis]
MVFTHLQRSTLFLDVLRNLRFLRTKNILNEKNEFEKVSFHDYGHFKSMGMLSSFEETISCDFPIHKMRLDYKSQPHRSRLTARNLEETTLLLCFLNFDDEKMNFCMNIHYSEKTISMALIFNEWLVGDCCANSIA